MFLSSPCGKRRHRIFVRKKQLTGALRNVRYGGKLLRGPVGDDFFAKVGARGVLEAVGNSKGIYTLQKVKKVKKSKVKKKEGHT